MLQYKTVAVPDTILGKVKSKEFTQGLSDETSQKAVEPISTMIAEQAKRGWTFHSFNRMQKNIARKKNFLELILGWIPILGNWLFPTMRRETKEGLPFFITVLVFVKEG